MSNNELQFQRVVVVAIWFLKTHSNLDFKATTMMANFNE
jgi:hypothetical protein